MKRSAPMKRTPFKRRASTEAEKQKDREQRLDVIASSAIKSVARPGVIMANQATLSTAATPIPKSQPVRSTQYRRAVASLPCCICGIAGQSQAAHGSGAGTAVCKGMGIKSCDLTCAPFCVPHHQQLDQGAMFTKAARHLLEPAWAADTQRKIHAMGKWPKGVPYPHDQQQGVGPCE